MLSKIAFIIPVAALGLAGASRPASADVAVRAQVTVNGGGASFSASLAPYGRWVVEPRYGSVFVPHDRDFAPYTRGHWVHARGGLTWVSDAPFGEITEHHGRWVATARGWAWVPGDEYAPAWVEWRDSGDAVGWAPLGPDDRAVAHANAWRFIPERSLYAPRLSSHYVPAAPRYAHARRFDAQRRFEDAQRRAEDAQRRAEDAQRRAGYNDPYSEQARRDAQAQRRAQQQQRRYEQMMRRGGPGADPAADRRDRERMLRDIARDQRAAEAARRDGFYR